MNFAESFKHRLLHQNNDFNFIDSSLELFNYQYHNNEIYKSYCTHLKIKPQSVNSLDAIPFLPIEFFKNHEIKTGKWKSEKVFKSSGTTLKGRSEHHIKDLSFYHQIAKKQFEITISKLEELEIIAILPSYLEQGDSSLINMVDYFIHKSSKKSGYHLTGEIEEKLKSDTKKMVIGVSYALLNLAERGYLLNNGILMETGGMKGRRKEITRNELHEKLKLGFGVNEVYSEYGMTELLSQAYGKNGNFSFPEWVKVLVRDVNDPFTFLDESKTGGINIIDLANVDSCAFIETKDLGRQRNDYFEILGRFDNSDIRGCNLMI